jgi:hypothetical protein
MSTGSLVPFIWDPSLPQQSHSSEWRQSVRGDPEPDSARRWAQHHAWVVLAGQGHHRGLPQEDREQDPGEHAYTVRTCWGFANISTLVMLVGQAGASCSPPHPP